MRLSKKRKSIAKGIGFGVTSGVITTLGLIVGLDSATNSMIAVVGGILAIAVADSFADALGIHVSEEAEMEHTQKEIWIATITTLFTKLLFAFTFIIPFLLFQLKNAVYVSVGYGIVVIIAYNYMLALRQKKSPFRIIGEHVGIAALVIILTHYIGQLVSFWT